MRINEVIVNIYGQQLPNDHFLFTIFHHHDEPIEDVHKISVGWFKRILLVYIVK